METNRLGFQFGFLCLNTSHYSFKVKLNDIIYVPFRCVHYVICGELFALWKLSPTLSDLII
ncbi:hypothetical protein BLOT_010606 [Blomia tropicalis]|nr:hypothetical protein BLOT_010606 [Blomia tropicalis]